MTFFKYSILLSTTFLLGFQNCWGMNNENLPSDNEKRSITKKSSPSSQRNNNSDDEDENFMQLRELGDVINDLGKELQNAKTPNKKIIGSELQSAPFDLRKKNDQISNDSFTTPVSTTSKEFRSAPPPIKKKSSEEIYKSHEDVSKKFLKLEKREFISKKAHILFIDFVNKYACKEESMIDITNLSARSKIYLLNSIINFKIKFLPPYDSKNMRFEQFKQWIFPSNGFWKKEIKTLAECTDLLPTTFKIGEFSYKLKLGATLYQKGSGRLHGLITENGAETYDQIHEEFKKYGEEKIKKFSTLLLKQKKDGEAINTNNQNEDRFFNGLNLLLDYEVARRLAKDDKFSSLPIISCLEFVIKSLHDHFEDWVIPKNSLFKGNAREFFANLITNKHSKAQSSSEIRDNLRYMHSSEEDSEDTYSGDEENFSIPKMQSFDNKSSKRQEGEGDEDII